MRGIWIFIAVAALSDPSFGLGGQTNGNGCGAGVVSNAEMNRDALLTKILSRFTSRGAMITSLPPESPDEIAYNRHHWVRDSGIVKGTALRAIERNVSPALNGQVWSQTELFFGFSRGLQLTHNRSGSPDNGGLGEPRFLIDGGVDQSRWAFPQLDGPALRAIAGAQYARYLLARDQKSMVRSKLFDDKLPTETVFKADVEFVLHNWMKPCFDVWEEHFGHHFFTRLAQRRALWDGAQIAQELGDTRGNEYLQAIGPLEEELTKHWSEENGHILSAVEASGGIDYKKRMLDSATIIAVNLASIPGRAFSVSDDRVMSTAAVIEETFEQIYPINQFKVDSAGLPIAPAIGRYPEDRYDGGIANADSGNPWVITTAAFAEYHFRLAKELKVLKRIPLTKRSLRLLRRIIPDLEPERFGGEISSDHELFDQIIARIHERGHEFLRRIRFHFPPGHDDFFEQFHRVHGYGHGAPSLTWSYAAYLSALLESDAP